MAENTVAVTVPDDSRNCHGIINREGVEGSQLQRRSQSGANGGTLSLPLKNQCGPVAVELVTFRPVGRVVSGNVTYTIASRG